MFSAGIIFFEIQQFGLKFDQVFIEQFENEKYPKIDSDDFDDFPWMIDCLRHAEKDRLSALEVFINLSNAFSSLFQPRLIQDIGNRSYNSIRFDYEGHINAPGLKKLLRKLDPNDPKLSQKLEKFFSNQKHNAFIEQDL